MNRTIAAMLLVLLVISLTIMAQPWPSARLSVPASDIIFSHDLHVTEMEIGCDGCHFEIESSEEASDRNFPTMDECAGCHDVESDDNCGLCHRNVDEPQASPHPDRAISFNHAVHVSPDLQCGACHGDVATSGESSEAHMPGKPICMTCHNGRTAAAGCELCHGTHITLADIHPADWRHQHADLAGSVDAWCTSCHEINTFCVDCHRGDNLAGTIHDLNYIFTHGLDAGSKKHDCTACHDTRTFCSDCHNAAQRMPLNHSRLGWTTQHGRQARQDVENCAACHDRGDPTCARVGCHRDADGLRGTDARIHVSDGGLLESKGAWHDDNRSFCFQCHTNTRRAGLGFCGYCHGSDD